MPIRHVGKSPIERIKEIKDVLQKLPVQTANTALNHFLDNFKTQSWEGQKWKARSGWADRNEGRAILHDTGILKGALTKTASANRAKVYVASPADKYADIHNEGGSIRLAPTSQRIKWAWAMYYNDQTATGKALYKAIALKMQSGKSLNIKIPKRQFIGHSDKLNQKLQDKIHKQLTNIWNT